MSASAIPPFAVVEASPEAFRQYQEQARTWEADRYASMRRQVWTAWTVAAGSAALAVVAVLGATAAYYRPIERAPVVQVDTTGAASIVPNYGAPPQDFREKHTRQMLAAYLEAREGWSLAEDRRHYDRTLKMTLPALQALFRSQYTNAESNRAVLGRDGNVHIRFVSIELLGPPGAWDSARVRYIKDTTTRLGHPPVSAVHVANIDFVWSEGAIGANDLLVNPYGFLVTRYASNGELPGAGLPGAAR